MRYINKAFFATTILIGLLLTITIYFHKAILQNTLRVEYTYPTVDIFTLRNISLEDKVPKSIIMTDKSPKDVPLYLLDSWTENNPNHKLKVYNDAEAEQLVKDYMPSYIYQTYRSLPKPILKADYFRYIALYVHGGVYTDTDTECHQPIDQWSDGNSIDAILAVEHFEPYRNTTCEQDTFARGIQFIQWTFLIKPRHPILFDVIDRIYKITPIMLKKGHLSSCDVLNWTGPGIWSDAVLNYLQISSPEDLIFKKNKIIKNIFILPEIAFTGFPLGEEVKARHLFKGSWKWDI